MPIEIAIIIFFVGSAIGSFLNVVILRLGVSRVIGRSRCPHCAKTLQWFELVPLLSFIFQKGRCRGCSVKLSLQYPVVEFLTGALFVLIFWRLIAHSPTGAAADFFWTSAGLWVFPLVAFWWYYVSVFLAISVYDIRHYIIPNILLFPAILVAIFGVGYLHLLEWLGPRFFPADGIIFAGHDAMILGQAPLGAVGSALLGVLTVAGFLGLIHWLSRGRAMGFGDVKLGILIGLVLGWPDALVAIFIAFMVGMFWGIGAMLMWKRSMKSYLPFGPFLAFGTIAAMLAGDMVMQFYFRVLPQILIPMY